MVENMLVDDSRAIYKGSDHNVIILHLKIPSRPPKPENRRIKFVDTTKAASEASTRHEGVTADYGNYVDLKNAILWATGHNSRISINGRCSDPERLERSEGP